MRMGAAGVMGMWMPAPGVTEYKVLRQVEGGAWEQIFKGALNNFQDPAAPADKDVSYKVVAVIGGADSGESAVVTLKGEKPIEPPAGISGRLDVTNKNLPIRWNGAHGASFYNIYRAEKAGDAGTLLTSVQDVKYVDGTIQEGKTYYYSVTSVSATNQESKRGEALKVEVIYPKEVKIKKFDPIRRELSLVTESFGEQFAEFKNPSILEAQGDNVYVLCEDGIQILDREGNYVKRLPLLQEKSASHAWPRVSTFMITESGSILLTFFSPSNTVREIDASGNQLLREIIIPNNPITKKAPAITDITVGPGGALWMVDTDNGCIVVVEANASGAVKPEKVRWLGYPRAAPEAYDPAKHGDIFKSPNLIRYLKGSGKIAVVEATQASIDILDPTTGKIESTIGGMGGALNQFSALSSIKEYDANSILVVDPLRTLVVRLKIAKAGDDTNGDYLESFVDDPEKKALNITTVGSVGQAAYVPASKRLYVLSGFGNEVLVYDAP
jgi:hypothetical protein